MTDTLIILFRNRLSSREIPLFRGAVIDAVGNDCSELFHNHHGNGHNFRYPLIQYKRIHGQAAIVCIGEGCEQIGAFFSNSNFHLQIGSKRHEDFQIESIRPHRTQIQVWDQAFNYYLKGWLPLNHKNFQQFQTTDGIADRIQQLEEILIGNFLSACKGMNVTINNQIQCKITALSEPQKNFYKGFPFLGYNCEFKANISLPDFIGLGKGASHGFGTVCLKRVKNNINTNTDE